MTGGRMLYSLDAYSDEFRVEVGAMAAVSTRVESPRWGQWAPFLTRCKLTSVPQENSRPL